jgi:hypothetical protein
MLPTGGRLASVRDQYGNRRCCWPIVGVLLLLECINLASQKMEGPILAPPALRDAHNQKLLDGIGLQHHSGAPAAIHERRPRPTNNWAERDLRPAVIARKVSHFSRNVAGARPFEVFTSVIQTLRKIDPVTIAAELMRLMSNPPAIASP